jgi:hypothetical protein
MTIPANPGSLVELDPGGVNVSFLFQVVPHPRVRCYFKATPTKFRSLVRLCFAIVDMTSQLTMNGSLPRFTSGSGGRRTSQSLFIWAWKAAEA